MGLTLALLLFFLPFFFPRLSFLTSRSSFLQTRPTWSTRAPVFGQLVAIELEVDDVKAVVVGTGALEVDESTLGSLANGQIHCFGERLFSVALVLDRYWEEFPHAQRPFLLALGSVGPLGCN